MEEEEKDEALSEQERDGRYEQYTMRQQVYYFIGDKTKDNEWRWNY